MTDSDTHKIKVTILQMEGRYIRTFLTEKICKEDMSRPWHKRRAKEITLGKANVAGKTFHKPYMKTRRAIKMEVEDMNKDGFNYIY